MPELRIRLFGGLDVSSRGTVLPPLPTRNAKDLLAFLVLHPGRSVNRDVLCGRLWGDQSDARARKTLRTALWRVRTMLRAAAERGEDLLQVDGQGVGFFARGQVWADVWEFESCLHGALAVPVQGPEEAQRLVRAAQLYRGHLLEGVHDEWCEARRERFHLDFLTAIEQLVDYHWRCEDWLPAILWGNSLLLHDPLREIVHRKMMLSHLARGDRPSALRQYQHCARALRDELGIEPMDETRGLRDRMLREGPSPHGAVPTSGVGDGGGENLVEVVDRALHDLYALAERLERAKDAVLRADSAPAPGVRPERGTIPPLRTHGPEEGPRRDERTAAPRRMRRRGARVGPAADGVA